jgi:predicted dehydrogenase
MGPAKPGVPHARTSRNPEFRVKALFVGLGGIGQRHARNLRATLGSDIEIIAWRVRRLSHLVTPQLQADTERDVEREYDIRVFHSLEAALAEQPQIAFICNPSSLHVPAALQCLRAGCDLFLEKPVSNTLDGLAGLTRTAEQTKRVVMVGYQLRFHPCFLALQEILNSGVLGSIMAVRATVGEYLPGWHPYEDYRQMYASRADLGGGVVVTQIHEFDYLYALFGTPSRIFSIGGHWSHLEIDVEDVASTLMEFKITDRPLPVHLQQDYLQRPANRSCEVIGDRGKAIMDLPSLSVTRYDQDGQLAETLQWNGFDRNQLFLHELHHFLECVKTRQKPTVDLNDGIWSLRMALAARESMASGRVVTLTK